MVEWLRALSEFPKGLEFWKIAIPTLIPALALMSSVWIAVNGWSNAENTRQREINQRLASEAAVACSEAFEQLYNATLVLKAEVPSSKGPTIKPTMAEASVALAKPIDTMREAYRKYRRSLVRLGALADLGNLKVTSLPSTNDGLLEKFDEIAWNATTRYSSDKDESKAGAAGLARALNETQDNPGFLSTYRLQLEAKLNQIMLGNFRPPRSV